MTVTDQIELTATEDNVNVGVPTNQTPSQYKNTNLSDLHYIKVADAIETFNYLPQILYIRGKVDTSDKTTQFYRTALTHNVGSQKFVNVQEPFTGFSMTAEQIEQSDLKGIIEPGKIYLLNGQNRFYNIAEMFTNSAYGKVTFNEIPVRYLSGVLNRSFIDRFQVNANDSTLKHPTMVFMHSVYSAYSNYIQQKTISDLAELEADIDVLPDKAIKAIEMAANKYAQDAFNVSAQYMSIVKILNSEATPDVLWDLMNNGWVNYEAAKLLVQACKALKLNVEATLSDLIQEFDINQYVTTNESDDKALITAPQVKKWRASHEASIKKAEKEKAEKAIAEKEKNLTLDSETPHNFDGETDDDITDDDIQSGVVIPQIDPITLKSDIHRAMGNLRTIAQRPNVDPMQNFNLFDVSNLLAKASAKQIDKAPQGKAKAIFNATFALAEILLDDYQLESMLPADLKTLSVNFHSMNEKLQLVLIEDDELSHRLDEIVNDDEAEEEAKEEAEEIVILAFQDPEEYLEEVPEDITEGEEEESDEM